MPRMTFGEQIDYLLMCGDIQGKALLDLYHLLKSYKRGHVSAQAVQEAIDTFDPEQLPDLPLDDLSML